MDIQKARILLRQILKGAQALVEDWEATERFLRDGVIAEGRTIRTCRNIGEAAEEAAFYREMVESIEGQLEVLGEKRGPVE